MTIKVELEISVGKSRLKAEDIKRAFEEMLEAVHEAETSDGAYELYTIESVRVWEE